MRFSKYDPHERRRTCQQQHSAQDVAHRLARKFPYHFGTRVVKHTQLAGLILKLEGLVLQSSRTSGDSDGGDENHGGYDEVQVALRQQHSTVSDTKSVEVEGQTCSVIGEVQSSAAAESIAQDNSEELAAAAMKTSKPENNGQLSETVEAGENEKSEYSYTHPVCGTNSYVLRSYQQFVFADFGSRYSEYNSKSKPKRLCSMYEVPGSTYSFK